MTMRNTASPMPSVGLDHAMANHAHSEDWPGWLKVGVILGLTGLLWTLIISGVALVAPIIGSWF